MFAVYIESIVQEGWQYNKRMFLVSVLLSLSVEICFVSRRRDFYSKYMYSTIEYVNNISNYSTFAFSYAHIVPHKKNLRTSFNIKKSFPANRELMKIKPVKITF